MISKFSCTYIILVSITSDFYEYLHEDCQDIDEYFYYKKNKRCGDFVFKVRR